MQFDLAKLPFEQYPPQFLGDIIELSVFAPVNMSIYLLYLQLCKCVDFLWRFARATYVQSGIEGNRGKEDRKKELVYASKDHAFKALELDGSSPDVQKWQVFRSDVFLAESFSMNISVNYNYVCKELVSHLDYSSF